MITRIIAAIATLSIFFCSVAYAADIPNLTLIDKDFNNGSISGEIMNVSGDIQTVTVPENPIADKSLQLYTSAQEIASVELKFSKSTGVAVAEMNFRCEGDRLTREISISDEENEEFTIVTVGAGGKIDIAQNAEAYIKDYKIGQWYHVALALDLNESTVSVYIDGSLLAKTLMSEEAPKSFSSVSIKQNGINGAADVTFIDDFKVYEADEPLKNYKVKKSKYFSTVVVSRPDGELSVGSSTSYEGVNLLLYADFEGDTDADVGPKTWTSVNNNGTIGAYKADKRHGYSVKLGASSKDGNPILAKDLFDYGLSADTLGDFVMDFDSLYSDNSHMNMFTIKDDKNETAHDIFRTTTSGGWALISDTDRYTGTYSGAMWYSTQVVFHSDGTSYQTYDLYLNDEKIADNQPIKGDEFKQIKSIRLAHYGTDAGDSFWAIDNFKIYQGSEPVKNLDVAAFVSEKVGAEDMKETSPFDDKAEIYEMLNPFIVIGSDCKNAIVNGKKEQIDAGNANVGVIIENGRTYVPVRFLSERLGAEVVWDGANQQVVVTYNGSKIVFNVGSNIVCINGEEQTMDAVPFMSPNRVYVPLRVITRAMNREIKWFSNGIVAVGDKHERFVAFDKTLKHSSLLDCAYRILYYPCPDKQKFLSDFNLNSNVHPSIVLSAQDIERIRNGVQTNVNMQRWYNQVKERADTLLDTPPNTYVLAGAGGALLNISRSTKERVENLAIAYHLTGDEKYKNRLWIELEAVCNFDDWNPANFLSCAEMTYSVTIGYDWLYNEWTQDERKFLENSIYKKALLVAKEAYTTDDSANWWAYATSNWNSVSNCNMGMAALALRNIYPQESAIVLERAFEGLGYFLPAYSNGGGFGEGPGYWAYAIKYLTCFMAALENNIGSDYGLFESPGLNRTAYFLPYMMGSSKAFNFHDSTETVEASPEILYLGKRMNKPIIQSLRMDMIKSGLSPSNIYDLIWYSPKVEVTDELPLDEKFENVSTVSFRSAWCDKNCTYAGIHAGSVNDAHSQLDMGDFVFDALGERWACELAMEDYSYEGYFNNFRWTFYRARAEGQNTIVINPSQDPDQSSVDSKGIIERFESKPRGGYTVINLTDGYPYAKSARRGLMLTDERRTVIVQDEVTMKDESEVYWFMHTKADIDISDDGKTATLTQNGKTMYARLISDSPLKFSTMSAEPLEMTPHVVQSENPGVRKLVISADYVKEFNVAVVFSPNESSLNRDYTYLDNWSIPDGEINSPHADGIYADGELLEGFKPFKNAYTIDIPAGEERIPDITVDSEYTVEMDESKSILDKTVIRVYDSKEPRAVMEYVISYQPQTIFGQPEGMKKLDIKEATASESPQGELGYTPDKTIDGDFETRWSAEAVNYLQYDLGENADVAAVGVAWLNGIKRQAYYSIELSVDGVNWETVYNGSSSGLSNSIETCIFKPVNCRYVRLTGYGNSQSSWISPNEVEIYSY